MTYPSIKETDYHAQGPSRIVLVVPHGAGTDDFFKFFPELQADPNLQKAWPLFLSYLEIERDVGACELAHSLAARLARGAGIKARVVELNYPRGLVDGGRLSGHCLRECLPPLLMAEIKEALLAVHDTSLSYMDRLYEAMKNDDSTYLLDVHTMASFCPVDANGEKKTFPISFEKMAAYNEQYLHAHRYKFQRKIDLICSDEKGRKLADPMLLAHITKSLEAAQFECLENEPYHAAPIYLSYQHMQKVPSLSLDVPKHLVVMPGALGEPLALDQLTIDPEGICTLTEALARGIEAALLEQSSHRAPPS